MTTEAGACVHRGDIADVAEGGAFPARCYRCGATRTFSSGIVQRSTPITRDERDAMHAQRVSVAAVTGAF